MRKKIKFFQLLFYSLTLMFLFNSCISLQSCQENIAGKYYYEKKSQFIDYLVLKEDGSYSHYYEKNGKHKSSSGNWQKIDDPYCKIRITNWEDYDKKSNGNVKSSLFYVNGDYLDRTPDGNDLDSFKKAKE